MNLNYKKYADLELNNKLQLHEMELEESKMRMREELEYLSDGKDGNSHFYAKIVNPDSMKKKSAKKLKSRRK